MQIGYKNKDPGVENDGKQIAEQTAEFYEKEKARVIKNTYANRDWTPISMELRHRAIDEIIRLFSDKMLELRQLQRDNEWRYKPQYQTYPNLKEDLRKFYPGWGGRTV